MMSMIATRAPRFVNNRAVAAPIPDPPPTIAARFPAMSISRTSSPGCR
jgi:hypothetical protein